MMKILIAEDKPESLALLDSFLKKNNYQTYCAPNGKVALEILEKNKVDLIISDILMPEIDGYILCKKVKSDPRWSNIPFIFYTATFTSRQDEIFAIKLGAVRFVRKPINPDAFGKIILDVLREYKKGTLQPAQYKFKEEADVFRLYNLRVIEKLEQKVSELEESETRYRILFETAAEGILIINFSSHQFKYANPAICLMLGYPEEELLKLGIADIHPKDELPEIRREFEALNHGQKSLAMDIPCQRKDGSILYANFSINQITMGGVKYSVAFVTDTTEYKKAMDALRSSEARLSTAMKIAKLGYWEIDNSDGLFTFDDNFYAIFHTTAAKEGGYKMSPKQYAKRFLHPDDQIMVAIEMQKSLQATDPHYHRQLEHRIIYADGGEGWIAVNFFIKKDDQGRTIGAFGVNQDITERKRMQEMIVQEQKELKLIIDTSPVIIFYKDKEGKFIRVNKAFADALQMNEADFIGKTVFDLYTKKIAQSMTDDDREVFKSNRPKLNIIEQYQSAGGLKWVQTDKIPIQDKNGNPIGLIGFTLDITERKQAEEALRKFENMLKLISENSRDIICLHDKNHKYLYVSPICKTLLGYKPEELIGTNPWELVHPEDLESLQKEGPVKAETEGISLLSYRIRKKSGKYIWFESASQTLRDDKGKITGYVTSSRDITKRKRVEEALIAERDKLQRVTDGLTAVEIGIDIVDINYQVLYQNLFLKNRFGDLTKQLCYDKYMNLKEPCSFCPMVKAIKTKLPQKIELTGADGKIYELLSAPLPDPDGTIDKVIEIVRDITERKQAEAEKLALETQLLQSQKMEAVGTLAGGIAHDFNNLLTIIQGHAQLMMAAKNEGDQEYYGLKQIVNAAFRAAQLTRQLLLFSRKQEMSFAILNPNRTIDNISKMLERLIGENIVIKLQLGDNLWNIEADEGNLEQVIMNLVVNARDAMPHGGTLTVKTENLELTEQDCALIPRSSPGKYICLTIQDTGCGIPPEVIDKIFDPFFTTKEAGKGTGLGLSVAYGIIKKHNGWINVKSELEKGTIFTICLPASQKSVLNDLTLKDQLAQKFGQDEPILVIEDDNDVRKFMVTILQHYHYVPLEAADAATATTIFQKEKEKIKLIIADVILPDRNGILLVEDFLATQAHIPVIMCSGYANEKVQHEIITKKKFHYLQKPIKAQTFLDLVHDTLASARK